MHYRAIAACILALAAVSCGTRKVSVHGESRVPQVEIASGESVTVVNVSSTTMEDLFECMEHSLHQESPDLTFVSSDEFRNAMFPWFEPGTAPNSVEELTKLMNNSAVEERIREFDLRYIIAVSGGTDTDTDTWGGCFGGYGGAGCVGGLSLNKQIDLSATLLDVKSLRLIGELAASGSGETNVGMIVIVPYVTMSGGESATCGALARRIAEILGGGPVSSENTRELVAPPATPR